MKRILLLFVLTALCLLMGPQLVCAVPSPQEGAGRDLALEQAILDRLGKIDPSAVPLFDQATLAMDRGDASDLAAARSGFEKVLALAPDFPEALRRLSYVELELGEVDAAVEHARRAYTVDTSPYNASAVARALLIADKDADAPEALRMAQEAVAGFPDDIEVNWSLLFAGLANDKIAVVREADRTLLESAPDLAYPHYIAGLLAADDEQWEKAEQELLRARDLGMPADDVQGIIDEYNIAGQARTARFARQGLRAFAYGVAGWLAGMALLFLLGLLLSALTLAAVKRPPRGETFRIGAGERIVRSLYAAIIGLTSAYFYLSLPVLAVIVIIGAGGIIWLMLRAGRVNLYLLALVGLTGFYTVAAIVWSLFTRLRDAEPGRLLPRSEAPRLWALAEEIAVRVSTRPVDAVYVTPGVEVAVTERGGVLRKLRGQGQRCLIVGLGALPGMTQAEFSAVLAHEYGHFSNRDTAGGNLAHQVRASIHHMAYRLATRGLARWYNPAWLFVNGFNRVFLRVTLGASRLQEILADRYAATAFGVRNFVDGLTRIVRLDLAFTSQVNREVKLALSAGRELQNLYTLPPVEVPEDRAALDKQLNEIMSRPTSPYDSHPAVSERIRLLQPLQDRYDADGEQAPVWDLFDNLDLLQGEMTSLVQKNVAAHQANERAARAAFHRRLAAESVPEVKPYQEALAAAIESGDLAAEAEALQDVGHIYEERDLPQRALPYYQLALESYQERNDRDGERVARFNLAEVFKTLGQLREAEEQLRRVVALDEALGSPDLDEDRQALAEIQA